VWIVLATYAQLQCGIDRMGISPLKWIVGYVKTGELDPEHSAVEECGQILISLALKLCKRRDRHYSSGNCLQELEVSQFYQCSDPTDKVFALLGFAKDCQKGELVADYSKSLPEICDDVVFLPVTSYKESMGPRASVSAGFFQ
jgi:hypothetical protein